MVIEFISFVFRYDYIDLKANSRLGREKESKLCPTKPRLSKSENDLNPYRVKDTPSFTIIDSTKETVSNQSKPTRPSLLKLNLKGVSRCLLKNGASDQSTTSKCRGHKSNGGNPPPSSFSRHHLLQTPEGEEEEEEETMFNSYQGPHEHKPLYSYNEYNHTSPGIKQEIEANDCLLKQNACIDPVIHSKGK